MSFFVHRRNLNKNTGAFLFTDGISVRAQELSCSQKEFK